MSSFPLSINVTTDARGAMRGFLLEEKVSKCDIHIWFVCSAGDFGLSSGALLSAPRGGHVGRPVAEEVQVS